MRITDIDVKSDNDATYSAEINFYAINVSNKNLIGDTKFTGMGGSQYEYIWTSSGGFTRNNSTDALGAFRYYGNSGNITGGTFSTYKLS
jgi:hypothetical protein